MKNTPLFNMPISISTHIHMHTHMYIHVYICAHIYIHIHSYIVLGKHSEYHFFFRKWKILIFKWKTHKEQNLGWLGKGFNRGGEVHCTICFCTFTKGLALVVWSLFKSTRASDACMGTWLAFEWPWLGCQVFLREVSKAGASPPNLK